MKKQIVSHGFIGGSALVFLLVAAAPAPAQQDTDAPPARRPPTIIQPGRPPVGPATDVDEAPGQDIRTDRGTLPPGRRTEANPPGEPGQPGGLGQPGQAAPGQARPAPEGWILIGADLDNDGQIDQMEAIHIEDLEQARRSSAGRRHQGGMQPGYEDSPSIGRVKGKVKALKSIHLAGVDGDYQIARIEEGNGRTARVALGAADALSNLDLKEGDEIEVRGRRGHINDRVVLMARRIDANGKTVRVKQPAGHYIRRFHGRLVGHPRVTRIEGLRGDVVVAQVRLDDGARAPTLLGSQKQLDGLGLKDGDEVSLLARPGRLNGRRAMVAEEVQANGRTVTVVKPGHEDEQSFETEDDAPPGPNSTGTAPTPNPPPRTIPAPREVPTNPGTGRAEPATP